jgi:hypothetical protein
VVGWGGEGGEEKRMSAGGSHPPSFADEVERLAEGDTTPLFPVDPSPGFQLFSDPPASLFAEVHRLIEKIKEESWQLAILPQHLEVRTTLDPSPVVIYPELP